MYGHTYYGHDNEQKRYPLDIMLAPTFHKAVPLHTLYFL